MEYTATCEVCGNKMKVINQNNDVIEFVCTKPRCISYKTTVVWGLEEAEQHRLWDIKEGKNK